MDRDNPTDPNARGDRLVKVPEHLHSTYDKRPFRRCLVCEGHLLGPYVIQKVWRASECILEMAVCTACQEEMSRQYSEESNEAMARFVQLRLGIEDCCAFCPTPREKIRNYTIVAQCRAMFMMGSEIICERCEDEIHEALSEKTQDVHDDFVRDHFPGLPAEIDFSFTF